MHRGDDHLTNQLKYSVCLNYGLYKHKAPEFAIAAFYHHPKKGGVEEAGEEEGGRRKGGWSRRGRQVQRRTTKIM